MRSIFWVMLALIGVLAVTGCRETADVRPPMVAFDRAYIPALAMTSQGKPTPSTRAMAVLQARWQALRAQADTFATQQSWSVTIAEVDARIAAANTLVAAGKLEDAHGELEYIRMVLMRTRQERGIDYFIDHLTAFHEPMENIVLITKGSTPATFTSDDAESIRVHLEEADALWRAVERAKFDTALFGFTPEQTTQLRERIARERAALTTLQTALRGTDKAAILNAAAGIKPTFAEIFMSFGDFTPVATAGTP